MEKKKNDKVKLKQYNGYKIFIIVVKWSMVLCMDEFNELLTN